MARRDDEFGAALIRRRFDEGSRDTRREQLTFHVNGAFVDGEQWIRANPKLNRLELVPRRDPDRVRFTDNRVGPNSETVMAKLLRRHLAFEVPPTSADDPQVEGAQMAERVLADLHREHQWENLRELHAWHVWKGGVAGLCVEWDPKAGRTVAEQGPQTLAPVHEGDTVESALSVVEMVTEPGVRDIEHARWWIKVSALPPGEVRERWGLEDNPPTDATAQTSPLARLLSSAGRSDTPPPELTLVLTYFERPNPGAPQGRVATVVGEKLVDGPHPWPFPFTDRLNVVSVTARPSGGRWTGSTRLSDAVEVQTALNVTWSSVVEHRKKAGNARLLVDETTLDLIDQLSDEPGEIVPMRPNPSGFKPDYLAPPSMSGHFEEIERLKAEIDDICGVHDVSRGDAPSNVSSGVALSLLSEQDDTPIGALSRRLGDAWARFASLVLAVLEAKVTVPRKARQEYDGLPPFDFEWTGQDFAGQTVATVPADVVSTEGRTARTQRGLDLLAAQVITPDQFQRFVEIPGGKSLEDPDEAAARLENHLMALGRQQTPHTYEDFNKHLDAHRKQVRSPGFRLWPPDRQQLLLTHMKATEVLAAEEMARQVQKGIVSPALAAVPTADGAVTPAFGEVQLPPAVPEAEDGEQQPDAEPDMAQDEMGMA